MKINLQHRNYELFFMKEISKISKFYSNCIGVKYIQNKIDIPLFNILDILSIILENKMNILVSKYKALSKQV